MQTVEEGRSPRRTGGPKRDENLSIYYVLAHEQFPLPELVEQGVAAEKAGFDGVWASDHFQPWQANEGHAGLAWVTLAALTQRTERVVFGTGVTCPIYRYRPAIVAQAWASLSLLAPGRVFLGLGTGEQLNEGAAGGGWGDYQERSSRLVEAIELIRRLWSGELVKFKGRYWQVQGKLYDPPASPVPIYIAAGGPKSARLSGLYGDGLITGSSLFMKKPELKREWERGVRESGRDPRSLPIVLEHWASIGGEKEARQAAELWRFVPKAWEPGYFDDIDPYAIEARAEAEVPLDSVYASWTVSAEPEEHIRAITDLSEAGATHVVVHVAAPDQPRVIKFFGKNVLPAIDRRGARGTSRRKPETERRGRK